MALDPTETAGEALGAGVAVGLIGTGLLWLVGAATGPWGFAAMFLAGAGTNVAGKIAAEATRVVEETGREAKKWSATARALTVAGCGVGFWAMGTAGRAFGDDETSAALQISGALAVVAGLSTAVVKQCC